jgi:hypothetical protein
MATRKTDYKIVDYRSARHPDIQKFKIILGGDTITIKKTYEEAQEAIRNLDLDPWFYDRGYTRVDRCK